MDNNNRQRTTIPILGLDTSTSDHNGAGGSMELLDNLRFSGGSWRDIKPFKKKADLARGVTSSNKISVTYDGDITSQYPVASDVTISVTWTDVDLVHYSTTSATLVKGKSQTTIETRYDSIDKIELSIVADNSYYYYTDGTIPAIDSNADEIIYQHPADLDNVYVFRHTNDDGTIQLYRAKVTEDVFEKYNTFADNLPSDIKLSHFGKILIASSESAKNIFYFKFNSGSYSSFFIPAPPIVQQSTTLSVDGTSDRSPCTQIVSPSKFFTTDGMAAMIWGDVSFPLYDIKNDTIGIPQFDQGAFYGEICFFATYQTNNGELLSPSALNICSSEPFGCGPSFTEFVPHNASRGETKKMLLPIGKIPDTGVYKNWFVITSRASEAERDRRNKITPFCFLIKPYVVISIPEEVDKDIIKYVNIYSTRVNPLLDVEKLKAFCADCNKSTDPNNPTYDYEASNVTSDFSIFFKDNKLPEQPFYLLKSIPIEDFVDGSFGLRITEEELANIEQKTRYESVSAHTLLYDHSKEFNSRLHAYGGLSTILADGFGDELFEDINDDDQSAIVSTIIDAGDSLHKTEKVISASIKDKIVQSRILSYPDYRAIDIYEGDMRYSLEKSLANNFAYKIATRVWGNATDFDYKNEISSYPMIYVKNGTSFAESYTTSPMPDALGDTIVADSNELRVSAENNPFVFPLANSYSIGLLGSQILAVNSGAIEMSDAKFGEFPLYIFTTEGVFAMQSGQGEVLYASTVPLNYDRIVNPNTLAVNYNVLYITSKGLHSIFSKDSVLISQAVNDKDNLPPMRFWESAQMFYEPKFSEVVIFNEGFSYAYVFSLENKSWSQREWDTSLRLLNNRDLVRHDGNMITIYDSNEEERPTNEVTGIFLETRPIKLGSMEFKRLETIIPRVVVNGASNVGETTPATAVTVEVLGSADLKNWMVLREATKEITEQSFIIRRTPASCRYFKIRISAEVSGDIAIDSIDLEYYYRFVRKMR